MRKRDRWDFKDPRQETPTARVAGDSPKLGVWSNLTCRPKAEVEEAETGATGTGMADGAQDVGW